MLTMGERSRYARQMMLPEIAQKGQELLSKSRVLVVGAGGLGCPVLQYLTAAGVGHIGIVDPDVVAESNLHRQVIYQLKDVGNPKCSVAAQALALQNPYIKFYPQKQKITASNVIDLISDYHIVIDCTDSFAAQYILNDACLILKRPLVYGSITQFEAQISVFALGDKPYSLHQLFPFQQSLTRIPNCEAAGVVGAFPGLVGSLQALEVIKIITGIGSELTGRVLVIDGLISSFQTFSFESVAPLPSPISIVDYEKLLIAQDSLNEISVHQLNAWLKQGVAIQLIDVRQQWETEVCSLGGLHLPLGSLQEKIETLKPAVKNIFYCHHGVRSLAALKIAQEHFPSLRNDFFSLRGGIDQWAISLAPEMKRY